MLNCIRIAMDARTQYAANGYCIRRGLIGIRKISSLLDSYHSFKRRGGIYYSQSNHNWRNAAFDTDAHGLLEKSMENFTDLPWAPSFGRNGRDILLSEEIHDCLCELSGERQDFCMWQNMLFDKSTGTVDHIDTWYLDTDPMGSLIAAWVALEDIDGKGGEFHVYPGSHISESTDYNCWKDLEHDQFVKWSEELRKDYSRKPIHLNIGDVLFWHPRLLHGSSTQKIQGHSRKSLTAHFYPVSSNKRVRGFSADQTTKIYYERASENKAKIRRYGALPIYANRRRLHFKRSLIGILKYSLNFRNQDMMLMSRRNYESP
jgi:phytanoyl-CoA hydroxylase